MNNKKISICLLLFLTTLACSLQNTSTTQPLEIKGSDTMVQVVASLAESFVQQHPEMHVSVTGGGSGTGIASLLNGEIDIADSSRSINQKEITQAQQKGMHVVEFVIGRDTLAVIVHKDNPVQKLTLEQLGNIYRGEIKNWADVGGTNMPITLYGRQSTSGTYIFFREEAVKGEYAATMRNMEGTAAIVEAVKQDKTGIGYVGIGYALDSAGNVLSGISLLSLGKNNDAYFAPSLAFSQQYPLSRPLYQYVKKNKEKNSVILPFLHFEISTEGQQVIQHAGFVPLNEHDKQQNLLSFATLES